MFKYVEDKTEPSVHLFISSQERKKKQLLQSRRAHPVPVRSIPPRSLSLSSPIPPKESHAPNPSTNSIDGGAVRYPGPVCVARRPFVSAT
jgi:hypothetical protein